MRLVLRERCHGCEVGLQDPGNKMLSTNPCAFANSSFDEATCQDTVCM
jgi:hypothetical protein